MTQNARNALLEAEGHLNLEIQLALKEFRGKLLELEHEEKLYPKDAGININGVQAFDISKEGPEKKFRFTQSLMTNMFKIQDFKTIYNMMIASFLILTISLLYDNYLRSGMLLDMLSLKEIFSGVQGVVQVWVLLVGVHFTIIPLTKLALATTIFVWLPLYLVHIFALLWLATDASRAKDIGFGSVFIVMGEAVRMAMKSHSYFRTKLLYLKDNQYKHYSVRGKRVVLVNKKHKPPESEGGQQTSSYFDSLNKSQSSEKVRKTESVGKVVSADKSESTGDVLLLRISNQHLFMQIRRLCYFFFVPTLIYRDEYTLTPVRSLSSILAHLINFLGCVYYSFMLYVIWCKPVIDNLANKLDLEVLLFTIINLMLPSVLFLIMGFFGFLHSWLNLWSEITRFPDRAFYADWWNSYEFRSYYRKWNIVVHDWLYYYIYLDLCRLVNTFRKHRWIPQLLTFVISALIHEFIIYFAIGFFYPILFILFAGPGIIFTQSAVKKHSVNLLFWIEMYIGTSMMFTLYLVECFARQQIHDDFISFKWGSLSFLIPRTLYLG